MANIIQLTRRTAALLLIASLAACGGGDGGGIGGGGNPGTGTPGGDGGGSGGGTGGGSGGGSGGGTGGGSGGGSGTQAVTGTYQLKPAVTTHAQMLSDANAMGQNSYVLLSTLSGTITSTSAELGDFYLTDTAHAGRKFSYINPGAATNMNDFVAQLNQQGSSGYMYKSDAIFPGASDIRSVYVKDNSRSDQFSYKAVSPVGVTAQAFSTELNTQGAAGYRYLGPQIDSKGQIFSLYAKRNDSVTYQYQIISLNMPYSAADNAGLQKLLTDKGAQGWFMRGTEGLGSMGSTFVDVYEKSSAQSGAIEYKVESGPTSSALQTQLTNMNANAANGFFFLSQFGTADGKFSNISVKNSVWMIHPLAGVSFP